MRHTPTLKHLLATTVLLGTTVVGCKTENVGAPDRRPMATDDEYFVEKGATLTANLFANDERGDPPGTISFGGGDVGGDVRSNFAGASVPLAGGTLTVNADGALTLANPTATGEYTFQYELASEGSFSSATVTITVGVAPTAVDDSYSTPVDGTLSVPDGSEDLLGNDDLGFPPAELESFGGGSLGGTVTDNQAGSSVAMAGGTITVHADGSFTVESPKQAGNFTVFYRIVNEAGSDDAAATIEVEAEAEGPSYSATGNVGLDVPEAEGLTKGATAGATVTEVQGNGPCPCTEATDEGGEVTVEPNGSFTFDPLAGFNGTDRFTFTLDIGAAPITGEITVNGMIWFIKNSVSGGDNQGTLVEPFESLGDFEAVNGNGGATDPAAENVIFIYEQGGGAYTGGVTLEDLQIVIGQGAAESVEAIAGITLPPFSRLLPSTGGTNPTIVNNATTGNTHGIVLGLDNVLRGLDVGDTPNGFGIVDNGSSPGAVNIDEASIFGTGGLLRVGDGSGTDAASMTFNSLSTSSSSADGIFLGDYRGSLTVTGGTTMDATNGPGITIDVAAPGAISFADTHIGQTNSAGITDGIVLSGGGSATISFGSVDVSTSGGRGLSVDNAGTLTINGGTIDAGSGTAVDISSTDLGITLESASSVGGSDVGINLNTTTGSFTVAGGTIANKTGADGSTSEGVGIHLTGVKNVTLQNMQLNDFDNFAIRGTLVDGFTLSNSTIDGMNGNSAPDNEGSVSFQDLRGSAVFSDNTVSGGFENNIRVVNLGDVLEMSVNGGTIGLNDVNAGLDGIDVLLLLDAALNLDVTGTTFSGARDDLVGISANGSSTADVVIQDNVFANNHPNILTGGISIRSADAASVTYDISGTTAGAQTFSGAAGDAITIDLGGTGDGTGIIVNNAIGVSGTPGSGSSFASGISVGAGGTVSHTVTIDKNDINGVDGFAGIAVTGAQDNPGGAPPVFNVTITNNIVDEMGGFSSRALAAGLGGLSGTENGQVCLDVRNNTFDVSALGSPTAPVTLSQSSSAGNFNLPGYAGSPRGEFPIVGVAGTASADLPPYFSGRGNTLIDGAGQLYPGVNASNVAGLTGTGTGCP